MAAPVTTTENQPTDIPFLGTYRADNMSVHANLPAARTLDATNASPWNTGYPIHQSHLGLDSEFSLLPIGVVINNEINQLLDQTETAANLEDKIQLLNDICFLLGS
jgi:hypothetical protein